jgi:hypothetical protein
MADSSLADNVNDLADEAQESTRSMSDSAVNATRDAVDKARMAADRAAARLPDPYAGAQSAANETQRRLDDMGDQTLLVGASFSLGLGIGLFFSGANRLLVAAALIPAAAMGITLFGRDQGNMTD